MFFFAMYKVVLALIESGDRFQILAESLINDESKIWHPVDSFKWLQFSMNFHFIKLKILILDVFGKFSKSFYLFEKISLFTFWIYLKIF